MVLVAYQDGPFSFERPAFSWGLVGRIFRHKETMLATGGYLGHMWELYAMWTWAPAFLLASATVLRDAGLAAPSSAVVELAAFGTIAVGGVGCVVGGWAADRMGRERWVNLAMAVSGACCLAAGLFYGGSFWTVALLTWIWGFFVVADSAQFSALVTEVAPSNAVGTALTLQTSLGLLRSPWRPSRGCPSWRKDSAGAGRFPCSPWVRCSESSPSSALRSSGSAEARRRGACTLCGAHRACPDKGGEVGGPTVRLVGAAPRG